MLISENVKDFVEFIKKETEEYFKWYINKTPQRRIKELKEQLKGQPKEIADAMLQENTEELTLEAMYIVRDIPMYYGEVQVRNNKALYWGYHTDIHEDSFANRPLIMGFEYSESVTYYWLVSDPYKTLSSIKNTVKSKSANCAKR